MAMVIKCPDCKREFLLKHKPGSTFTCPKCSFSAPFNFVLNGSKGNVSNAATNAESSFSTQAEEATKVVGNQDGQPYTSGRVTNPGEKTKLVPHLQSQKKYAFQVSFNGNAYGKILLPGQGQFSVGRKSHDSSAQLKITPDLSMSRVHAWMRVGRTPDGNIVYQIISVKENNPVFVNSMPVSGRVPCTLKVGDIIQMGETMMVLMNA